jgi:hypothetical protein
MGSRNVAAKRPMRDFPKSLRVIDILAFQNLLREEDDVYLRRTLRRRSYRRVKRARIRAAHEYLLGSLKIA